MALGTRVTYSGTFTPAANSLLVVAVDVVRNGTATPWTPSGVTVTGGGLTWTRRAIATGAGPGSPAGDYADSVQWWTAPVGGSPTSMSVTVNATAGDAAYATSAALIYGYTGYDVASPVGAILQATNGPTDGLWSPTLGATPAATSEVLSAFGGITAGAGDVNPEVGSGWTAVGRASTTSLFCLETQARRGSTSDVCAWSDTSGPSATTGLYYGPTSVAVEIKDDGLPAAPEIASTSSASPQKGAALTVTGTTFGASQGTQQLRIGGQVQPILSWSDTSIVVGAVDRGLNKYGVPVNVEIWDGTLQSNSYALTSLQPQPGWAYIDLGTPNATSAYRFTAVADLASGDQIALRNWGGAVIGYTDATWSAAPWVGEFEVEAWTSGDGWGEVGLQIIDLGTPNPRLLEHLFDQGLFSTGPAAELQVVEAFGGAPLRDGQVGAWDGSAWVRKPVKVWDGSAWVTKPAKVWDGAAWALA